MNRSILNYFLLCTAVCAAFPLAASARIRTLPLAELVGRSDHIVIGEVRRVTVTETRSAQGKTIRYLNNYVVVTEQLKGSWPCDKPMVFKTLAASRWIEDNVEFPAVGARVLLFVRKNRSGGVSLVNGIQGLWPLQDGKPLRMGTGRTLVELRALIGEQAERKEKRNN